MKYYFFHMINTIIQIRSSNDCEILVITFRNATWNDSQLYIRLSSVEQLRLLLSSEVSCNPSEELVL